ncbi:MAG: hypothetical protein WCS09_16260 [Pseudomonadota bacterium]
MSAPLVADSAEVFQFAVRLRTNLVEVVSGVRDAGWSLFWDNTTPNSSIRSKLKDVLEATLKPSAKWGLLVITRHCSCDNPTHVDYFTSNRYAVTIPYLAPGFRWDGGQLFQGTRIDLCPCDARNKPCMQHVIDEFVISERGDVELCKRLDAILCDISDAIGAAADKKPRSGIRENLLRAIIKLNDLLLPEPVDMYISKQVSNPSGSVE